MDKSGSSYGSTDDRESLLQGKLPPPSPPPGYWEETEVQGQGCCSSRLFKRIRRSRKTAVVVMFLAFMLDLMLLTVVEPVLPEILRSITQPEKPDQILNKSLELTQAPPSSNGSETIQEEEGVDPVLVGFMNGAKPLTQVVLNPIIGCLVDRVGHTGPMLVGFLVAFVSTIGFAYANSVIILMVARCVQGLGSSLMTIAGLSMLASVYRDPEERGKAMGVAFSGLGFGLIVGYPFGSIVFQFVGREVPFLSLAGLILIGALVRFCLMPIKLNDPEGKQKSDSHCSSATAICDGYILVAGGAYLVLCYGVGTIMGLAPLLMLEELDAEQWQIGVVFLIGAVFQNIAQYSISCGAYKIGWWLLAMLGLFLVGIGVAAYTTVPSLWFILLPQCIYAFGIGLVMGSIPALLGNLADIRANSQYGAVYALSDTGTNLGYFLGSTITGLLVNRFSYFPSFFSTGVVIFMFGWMCFSLRNVPAKESALSHEEQEKLTRQSWRRQSLSFTH